MVVDSRLKDAIFIRRKNNELREQLNKNAFVNRRISMEKEKANLGKFHHDDRRDLLFIVQNALNKMIFKRRKDFEK